MRIGPAFSLALPPSSSSRSRCRPRPPTRGAIKGCEINKWCDYQVNSNGSVDLFVVNGDFVDHVHCPKKGDCICVDCRTGDGAATGATQVMNYPPRG